MSRVAGSHASTAQPCRWRWPRSRGERSDGREEITAPVVCLSFFFSTHTQQQLSARPSRVCLCVGGGSSVGFPFKITFPIGITRSMVNGARRTHSALVRRTLEHPTQATRRRNSQRHRQHGRVVRCPRLEVRLRLSVCACCLQAVSYAYVCAPDSTLSHARTTHGVTPPSVRFSA